MEETKEKITYKPRSIRMHEKTWELLKKKKGDKSWNLFISNLLKDEKK